MIEIDAEILAHVRYGLACLTPRRRQTLALALQGMTSADIGVALGLSPRTAESHLVAIKKLTGVSSIVVLAVYVTALEVNRVGKREEGILTHF